MHCAPQQVEKAINLRPVIAGIPVNELTGLLSQSSGFMSLRRLGSRLRRACRSAGFMAATIPADVTQSAWPAIVMAQKLA